MKGKEGSLECALLDQHVQVQLGKLSAWGICTTPHACWDTCDQGQYTGWP